MYQEVILSDLQISARCWANSFYSSKVEKWVPSNTGASKSGGHPRGIAPSTKHQYDCPLSSGHIQIDKVDGTLRLRVQSWLMNPEIWITFVLSYISSILFTLTSTAFPKFRKQIMWLDTRDSRNVSAVEKIHNFKFNASIAYK